MNDEKAVACEQAVSCFAAGFSCSQAVLSAFCPGTSLDRDLALKVACAFGGGMASTGNVCGAVTGGLMAIGLHEGRYLAEDLAAKDRTYELSRQLMAEFRKRHGSLVCRELLGFDLGTPEGKAEFKSDGRHMQFCTQCVKDAATIVESLM